MSIVHFLTSHRETLKKLSRPSISFSCLRNDFAIMSTINPLVQTAIRDVLAKHIANQTPTKSEKVVIIDVSQSTRENSGSDVAAVDNNSNETTIHRCSLDAEVPITDTNVETLDTSFAHSHGGSGDSSLQDKTSCNMMLKLCMEANKIFSILPSEMRDIIADICNNKVSADIFNITCRCKLVQRLMYGFSFQREEQNYLNCARWTSGSVSVVWEQRSKVLY